MSGNVVRLKTRRVMVRQCPGCGYACTQVSIEWCKFNAPCPRCHKHKISEFKTFQKEDTWL